MRTIDQINEDIDYLLDEGRDYRADLDTLEQVVKDNAADYRRAEHEHDAATLHELDSLSQDLREQRAAVRRNDAELLLAQQERWEHNVINSLAGESEALFDAKVRLATDHEAYQEALRELRRCEYAPVGERTVALRRVEATHAALSASSEHLSNVRAVFESTQASAKRALAKGREVRSTPAIQRALAA